MCSAVSFTEPVFKGENWGRIPCGIPSPLSTVEQAATSQLFRLLWGMND